MAQAFLLIETLPAHPGEEFRGTLQANFNPTPRHPLSVELVCEEILWITSGHGKDRQTRAIVSRLGQARGAAKSLQINANGMGVRCPVEVAIPMDLPEYSINEVGNGVRWVLSLNTTGDDQPFSCAFDVPIFEAPQPNPRTDGNTA